MSGGEANPFIRKNEKIAIRVDAEEAKHQTGGRENDRRLLNPDQERRLGRISITDGVPIITEAPEEIQE